MARNTVFAWVVRREILEKKIRGTILRITFMCNPIRIVFVIGCDAWQIRRVLEF